ncbi:hypothetical protein FOYG_16734 [Fusarium oxysporum NRRL 32931]|uniref:Uncharacterized protein n=1 Tax=Fusarium oxysporum NRRL 32931 TaxID=660029 RepID=W9HE27_FUSOX|nr:hypothetical protein FOYG_16734 [Fusarium oxysporum NRRL 32931]
MTREAFNTFAHEAVQRFESVIGTNDPDLTAFFKKGGKILGYRGTFLGCYTAPVAKEDNPQTRLMHSKLRSRTGPC